MAELIKGQQAASEPSLLIKGLKSNVLSADYVALQSDALIVISAMAVIVAAIGIRMRLGKQ